MGESPVVAHSAVHRAYANDIFTDDRTTSILYNIIIRLYRVVAYVNYRFCINDFLCRVLFRDVTFVILFRSHAKEKLAIL